LDDGNGNARNLGIFHQLWDLSFQISSQAGPRRLLDLLDLLSRFSSRGGPCIGRRLWPTAPRGGAKKIERATSSRHGTPPLSASKPSSEPATDRFQPEAKRSGPGPHSLCIHPRSRGSLLPPVLIHSASIMANAHRACGAIFVPSGASRGAATRKGFRGPTDGNRHQRWLFVVARDKEGSLSAFEEITTWWGTRCSGRQEGGGREELGISARTIRDARLEAQRAGTSAGFVSGRDRTPVFAGESLFQSRVTLIGQHFVLPRHPSPCERLSGPQPAGLVFAVRPT